MQDSTRRNFILQQGFESPVATTCSLQYSTLQFQPRIVFLWIIAAMAFQASAVFLALAAVLWWSALLPGLNPFDAIYNSTFGRRPGSVPAGPAPPPRRTAQAMAGGFAVACALLLYFGYRTAAFVLEAIFLAAVLALILGGFCLGSFVYHLLRGRGEFLRQTMPWSR